MAKLVCIGILFSLHLKLTLSETQIVSSDRPTNLAYSNITSDSVTLMWTSGYDGGAQQHFMVWQDVTVGYMGISERIYDNSSNHGVNNNVTYVLRHLGPTSWYNLTIGAGNSHGDVNYVFSNFVDFWTRGPPQRPTHLAVSDITNNSAGLHWTSGYDGGSQQYFIVFKLDDSGNYIQYSDVIVDDSPNHGIDGNFTYVVKHLEPSTHYHMKVAATNSESDPQLSESTADFWTKGRPQKPTDLWFSDLTFNSVVIHWTSGYDGGSQQEFMVMKWLEEPGVYIQYSKSIVDDSTNHGVGDKFSFELKYLHPNTYYKLSVATLNSWGALMSDSYVEFTTNVNGPVNPFSSSNDNFVRIIIGSVVGGLAVVGVLAFVVYMLKYRRMRTSYENMKEKNKGSTKFNRTVPIDISDTKHVQKVSEA